MLFEINDRKHHWFQSSLIDKKIKNKNHIQVIQLLCFFVIFLAQQQGYDIITKTKTHFISLLEKKKKQCYKRNVHNTNTFNILFTHL